MLNKYYNNCQKHVEKCSESFGDFRNISFIEHVLSLIFFSVNLYASFFHLCSKQIQSS